MERSVLAEAVPSQRLITEPDEIPCTCQRLWRRTERVRVHPEAKCADASSTPCGKQSVGLLGRRHVQIEKLYFIGKESNKLEEVEEQAISDAADIYNTEYPDTRHDEWVTKILPILREAPASAITAKTGN